MKKQCWVIVFAAILSFSLTVVAIAEEKPGSGWALDAKVGTLGIGADVSRSIVPRLLNMRVGASFFSYSTDFDEEGISYNADLKLGAVPIALDVFPFRNWFRLGGGVLINLNEVTGTAQATNGTVTIGDTKYNLADLGQVQGKVKFNRAAPYFGLGFNNPIKKKGHLGFFADLGVMYHGNPFISLTTAKTVPNLQANIDKQVAKTNEDLKRFTLFPIIQFGISYKF
jgi:hypothetical protein